VHAIKIYAYPITRAIRARLLKTSRPKGQDTVRLPYRPSLINCNTDIGRLTKCLGGGSSARICLFGPPGTGKTAWASHLAKSIRRPLLVKHASDILDKYVGGTEKNIASAFQEATRSRSILTIDEIDGFIPDRSLAISHWEVSRSNQFLTAMERYEGLLICTTNLMSSLNPATMRRFDFKIDFDYLKSEEACVLAADLLSALGVSPSRADKGRLREGLATLKLSHGDFAALLRRYTVLKSTPDVSELLADLISEAGFRDRDSSRSIGFTANL
jgi:replication-associated recombination protein RarA